MNKEKIIEILKRASISKRTHELTGGLAGGIVTTIYSIENSDNLAKEIIEAIEEDKDPTPEWEKKLEQCIKDSYVDSFKFRVEKYKILKDFMRDEFKKLKEEIEINKICNARICEAIEEAFEKRGV